MVTSLGGAVVGKRDNPTLAILQNDHRAGCQGTLTHLVPRCRIVRERWLLRLEGLAPGVSLPDFKPDASYARVGDVRDPGSYFYRAVPDADLVGRRDDDWKPIPEDWTPSPAASATWRFDCLCGVSGTNYDDGLAMWECSTCNTWQHAACAGGAEDAVCPEDYTCSRCRSQEAEAAARRGRGAAGEPEPA